MPCVRRNNAPADGNSLGFARDDCSCGGGRSRLHRVFPPPGICFGYPKNVETGSVASLRHAHRLVERFHAQLQNTYLEGQGHEVTFSKCSWSSQSARTSLIWT